jgi:hypothetical protein
MVCKLSKFYDQCNAIEMSRIQSGKAQNLGNIIKMMTTSQKNTKESTENSQSSTNIVIH